MKTIFQSLAGIALFLLFHSTSLAQLTRISGKVTDALTGEPIPFASVVFKKSTIGVNTNIDGFYTLESDTPSDSIAAQFLGYITVSLPVKKGQTQTINFLLKASKVELKEAVIHAGENPANIIIKKVIANRDNNNFEKLNSYSFETYNKLEFDLTNITDKFKNRKIFKPFAFIFDNIDSTTTNEKPFLPIFITESLSDRYLSNNPKDKREIIKASKVSGVENETVTQFLGDMYQNINIYDNFMDVFGKKFVSPISSLGLIYYKYYLLDSLYMGNNHCYKLKFKPRRPEDLTFTGEMYITDTSWAVKKVNMRISNKANINFVEDCAVVKEYEFVDSTMWMLSKDLLVIEFAARDKGLGLIGRKSTSYKNFELNKPIPAQVMKGAQDVVVVEGALEKDSKFWDAARHDSLNEREKKIYTMVDTIKSLPAYKTYVDVITLFVTGYKTLGKVDLGPYFTVFSFNEIEGYRFRLGGKTNQDFSKHLRLEGFVAYGTKNEQFNYSFGTRYLFTTKPRMGVGFKYRHDVMQLGQSDNAFQDDNILASLFRRSASNKLTYTESEKIYFEKEWLSGVSGRITFEHNEFIPLGKLDYRYYTNENESNIRDKINTSDISAYFRFAYREKFVESKHGRVSLGSKYPVLQAVYTQGLKGVLRSDFDYQKLIVKVDDYLYTAPIGYLYYVLEAGKVWGKLPYPLLEVHRGNESYFYDYLSFNLMNYYEFVSDQYFAFYATHHFEGFFLDKIPLLKKLKWREVASLRGVYGSMSQKNHELMVDPTFNTLSKKPYLEAGFGVENILKIIRVDFIYRLSYLDNPDISKFGIRGSLQLTF